MNKTIFKQLGSNNRLPVPTLAHLPCAQQEFSLKDFYSLFNAFH